MKKLLILCSVLCLLALPAGVSQVYAGTYGLDITINDNAGPDGLLAAGEDNETESGTIQNQNWDLEAFQYNKTTNQLAVIGGFPFPTGKVGDFTEPLGALFISTAPGNVLFGSAVPAAGAGDGFGVVPNSTFSLTTGNAYQYAITFNFGTSKYTVWQASTNGSDVVLRGDDGSNSEFVSNPWSIFDPNNDNVRVSGWSAIIEDSAFTYTPNLANLDTYSGTWNLAGVHNVISGLSLDFLPADTEFLLHLTYACGNDNLMGLSATPPSGVPIPGSLLLLGSGLAGLGLTGFSRRKKVS